MKSNWEDLERWLEGQQLPRGFDILREPNWVEQYVRKMMTKALPEAAGVMIGTGKALISETRHFVHVKIDVPDDCDKTKLRLFVREDRLKIEGLIKEQTETIKLPKLVRPRTCKTQMNGRILHIKLQKRPNNRKYIEAAIQL